MREGLWQGVPMVVQCGWRAGSQGRCGRGRLEREVRTPVQGPVGYTKEWLFIVTEMERASEF